MRVRMGLHSGKPVAGTEGYVGIDVHRTARICQAGWGGQILLSEATRSHGADHVISGSLLDLGSHRLKDLQRPEKIFQVLHPDLAAEFPALRSLDRVPNNLPVQLNSFMGREREIAEIQRLLATTRLLTLTGSGGAGKTRLALHAAADLVEEYADGVWLAELAPLADPALLPQTLAAALQVREQPGRPIVETLADHLKARDALLVLDNCEHLVAACAALVEALLRRCPHLRVLATSREPLAIAGETTWRVPPLPTPEPDERPSPARLLRSDATRLFVDRAAAVLPEFALTDRDAAAVGQICRRLDGIPLAIELAAARVAILSPNEIAARLDDRFRLLTGGSRTALPRQQTLRATLDWSHQLLSEPERVLLRRLSVFAGGFTLEAAEAVCGADVVSPADVLDILERLVRKSLVLVLGRDAVSRYGMLETLRQYARDRLEESEEAPDVRTRHLNWVQALVERAHPELEGPDQGAWLQRLDTELDNLRAALEWSRTGHDLIERGLWLAGALWMLWFVRNHWGEGRAWLEDLVRRSPGVATSARARALYVAANLACFLGDYGASTRHGEEALTQARALGDSESQGWALYNLGLAALLLGEYERAATLLYECRALARSLGRWFMDAAATQLVGQLSMVQGDYSAAARYYDESLSLERPHGSKELTSLALSMLVYTSLAQGDYQRAALQFAECASVCRELGDDNTLAIALGGVAGVIGRQGQPEQAVRLFGAVDAAMERTGYIWAPSERVDIEREVQFTRRALGNEAYEAAYAEGRTLSFQEAVDSALMHARTLQG